MPTLYHAPNSRSDGIVALIHAMGLADRITIREVDIPRQDGSGRRDPANPHPEGKVPYLVDGDDHVRERGAITLWLTDRFPENGYGRPVGDPQRGAYLSWLFWYQGVFEPVLIFDFVGITHPALSATFRDRGEAVARIAEALRTGPWLLGERFSAADLLVASPFHFFSGLMPDDPAIRDWAARCKAVLDGDDAGRG